MNRNVKVNRHYESDLRREHAEATRRRIVDAADRLFREVGYEKTTIAAIARLAKVAVQTLYGAFSSKEQIGVAVIERVVVASGIRNASAEGLEGADPEEAFRGVAAGATRLYAGQSEIIDLLGLEFAASLRRLAGHVAGLPVTYEVVKGMTGVGDLGGPVSSSSRPEQRPVDARAGLRRAPGQKRGPGLHAGAAHAYRPRALVRCEQVQRPAVRTHQHLAQARAGGADIGAGAHAWASARTRTRRDRRRSARRRRSCVPVEVACVTAAAACGSEHSCGRQAADERKLGVHVNFLPKQVVPHR